MALTDNIVSYWKLDGDSVDTPGTNDGTDTNITYSTGNGKINQGAGFNGTTSKIIGSTINGVTDYSLACWFKTSSSSAGVLFGFAGVSSYPRAYIDIYPGAKYLEAVVQDTDGVIGYGTQPYNAGGWNDGLWRHIVITVSKSGSVSTITTYVDGTSYGATTETFTGNFNSMITTFGNLNSGAFFSGALDECGYWSRALSSTEVTALYNSGNGNQYPFSTAYELLTAVGEFTLTGISTLLNRGWNFAVNAGSFALTGINVLIERGRGMTVTVGQFTLTGIDTLLTKTLSLGASVGAFTLTGVDAILSRGLQMLTSVGNFTLTGVDVILTYAQHIVVMAVEVGQFILTGMDIVINATNKGWGYITKHSSTWTDKTKHSSTWTYKNKS